MQSQRFLEAKGVKMQNIFTIWNVYGVVCAVMAASLTLSTHRFYRSHKMRQMVLHAVSSIVCLLCGWLFFIVGCEPIYGKVALPTTLLVALVIYLISIPALFWSIRLTNRRESEKDISHKA